MPIIKLNAIDSTNDYLKLLAKEKKLENYTVVTANYQTKGKGQRGNEWVSEEGKNLIMSVLIEEKSIKSNQLFTLNIAITLSVTEALKKLDNFRCTIKWPNDIMSDSKKIGGILIENNVKSDGSISSIVGIGINVNQTNFIHLPKATSLITISNKEYNLDVLVELLIISIKKHILLLNSSGDLWSKYHQLLFKIDVPMAFEDNQGKRFMGIIKGVTSNGLLALLLEDDTIKYFDVKEIQMLY